MAEKDPPVPTNPTRPARGFGGWVPAWFRPRTSWIPNAGGPPVTYRDGTDEAAASEALRVTGATQPASVPIGDKPVVGPPPGYEQPFNDVISSLSSIQNIGRSTNESIWDCLGSSTNTKNGRLGSALLRGATARQIIAAFVSANEAGRFADTHYDGSDIWFKLMYPQDVDPGTGAPNDDLPITYDAEAAYDRLVTYGIGYDGNKLDPGLVAAAIAAMSNPPKGYEKADPITILFVFAYSLDRLPGSNPLLPGGADYADVYASMTPQEVLDHEKKVRESGAGPSGFEKAAPLPPAGTGKKVPKAK